MRKAELACLSAGIALLLSHSDWLFDSIIAYHPQPKDKYEWKEK